MGKLEPNNSFAVHHGLANTLDASISLVRYRRRTPVSFLKESFSSFFEHLFETSRLSSLTSESGTVFSKSAKSYLKPRALGMPRVVTRSLSTRSTSYLNLTNQKNSSKNKCCRPTFIFDPSGRCMYVWKGIVACAFLYNLWILVFRYTFEEINSETAVVWFLLDYLCDLIYILDIVAGFRTGFLCEGVLQTNPHKIKVHYVNTLRFYLDCLAIIPLDLLYLSFGYCSLLRFFRLIKVYRCVEFTDATERHSSYPNFYRFVILVHSFLVIFHWNAGIIFLLRNGLDMEYQRQYQKENGVNTSNIWSSDDNIYNYLLAYYISCKTLTLIEVPRPNLKQKWGIGFVVLEIIMALVLFSSILGFVASVVSAFDASKKEFQVELDKIKSYMKFNNVERRLQDKVIRWYDYLWQSKRSASKTDALHFIPDKLKAEISLNVYLDVLRRVELFQNTEPGFLQELVLRLRHILLSPGDFICRKGEVGKEMYIVGRGKLKVLGDDGQMVLAYLKAGSYFGEIAILNMGGTAGNRRTATVVSVGYSDLYCLRKKDIWEVLQDYPTARFRLEQLAQKRLGSNGEAQNMPAQRLKKAQHLSSPSGTSRPHYSDCQLKMTSLSSLRSVPGVISRDQLQIGTSLQTSKHLNQASLPLKEWKFTCGKYPEPLQTNESFYVPTTFTS